MRRLERAERTFLQEYFGASLALEPIWMGRSLGRRSWSPIGNRISLSADLYRERDPRAPVRLDDAHAASIFAHEALHVWQRQHGRAVTREGALLQSGYALGLFDPYAYDERVEEPAALLAMFALGNIEQQGRIFEHFVFSARIGREVTRFQKVAAWVRGARR
jgi:hypothetical protein